MEWYKGGVQFECTGCGACCKDKGYVIVGPEEAKIVASFLGIGFEEFCDEFLVEVIFDNRSYQSFTEFDDEGCPFLDDDKCKIYSVRPTQCKSFPFWTEYLETEEGWQEAKNRCDGIGCGRHYSCIEIKRKMRGLNAFKEEGTIYCPRCEREVMVMGLCQGCSLD